MDSRCSSAPAARAATTPTVYLDDGNVSTAGSLLRAKRVPILTSTGAIVYKDVTIQFVTNATGTLSLTSTQQPSPPIFPNLVPGIYYLPGYPTYALDVTAAGPGGIYTIAAAPKYNAACGGPATVSAYNTANKQYNRLRAAGITPDSNTLYGTIGGPVNGGSYCQNQTGYLWNAGSLIGVQQSGSSISIETFTYDGVSDSLFAISTTTLDRI